MHRKIFSTGVLLLIAILGGVGLFFATSNGLGLFPDTPKYFNLAHNLYNHYGFVRGDVVAGFKEFTQAPPFYSIVLTLGYVFSNTIYEFARSLNIALFCFNIFLIGGILFQLTRSFSAAYMGAFFFMSARGVLETHAFAMTEPLFLFFMLGAFLLTIYYMEHPSRSVLFSLIVFSALAAFTRYTGIILILVIGAAIIIRGRFLFRDRLRDAVLFCVMSFFPIGLWLWRGFVLKGTIADRVFILHFDPKERIVQLWDTVSIWFWNQTITKTSFFITCGALILVFITIFVYCRRKRTEGPFFSLKCSSGVTLLALFGLIYFWGLTFVIAFFDASSSYAMRLMLPVFITFLIVVVCVVWHLLIDERYSLWLRVVVLVCSMTVTIVYSLSGIRWIMKAHDQGVGYAGKVWQNSGTLRFLRSLPSEKRIYSNGSDAIRLLTDRTVFSLPRKVDPITGSQRRDYSNEFLEMKKRLLEDDGVIVYLYNIKWRYYLPSEDDLKRDLSLEVVCDCLDGIVYKLTDGPYKLNPGR